MLIKMLEYLSEFNSFRISQYFLNMIKFDWDQTKHYKVSESCSFMNFAVPIFAVSTVYSSGLYCL